MERVGFILKVKQDRIGEYRQHHKQVWAEMLDALRAAGWNNYSLFLRDDGTLFGYFEAADNFQTSLAAMARTEINAKWQSFMAPYFESITGRADENLIQLQEVFHLD